MSLRAPCLVLLALLMPGAAEADAVRLDYRGYIGAAEVLRLAVGIDLQPGPSGRYRMAVDAATLGTIGALFPFQVRADAYGLAAKAAVRPERYRSLASLWQRHQTVTLIYGADGRMRVAIDPPGASGGAPRPDDRTLDPISAVLAIIVSSARNGGCGGSVPVFDGFRRYDLLLASDGFDVIERSATSYYQGPAAACTVTVALGEGVRADEAASGVIPTNAQLWLAEVDAGLPALPVRVSSQSALGELRLDLVGLSQAAGGMP